MEFLLLSIWLSLMAPGLASSSTPYYIITVPAQVISPSVEKACITLLHLQEEIKLKMELKKDEKSNLVIEDTIKTTPNYFHCYSFKLPLAADNDEVWLFHVSIQGENFNIDQTKKILLIRGSHVTLIQTDKPIYKPGQTVNFRVVTLDKTYHAQTEKYSLVEILDPNKNCIGQWRNVTPNQGIADFSFPLAKELPLGDYRIHIAKASSTTFSVSDYVLKKFEIIISAPHKVPVMGESFKIEVCGRYTYGKPVLGSIDLIVCIKEYMRWGIRYLSETVRSFSDENLEDCQQIKELQTDERGCLSRDMDLGFFNISNIKNYQYLGIKSSLRDYTTGQTEIEPAVYLFQNSDTMQFVDLAQNYQRGIPFTVKLKVLNKKNEPKANQTVILELGFENKDVNMTSVTDGNGLATFTLDTSTWDDMVSVTGKFSLEEKGNWPWLYSWLYPFYSETNSYLNVEAVTDNPSCDTDQPVTVEYYINKNALDAQSQHLSFFFLLLNIGITSSGEYKLDVTEQSPGPVLQGSFSLKIPKYIEYSPEVTFVIYTVLLNGDVAASKKKIKFPQCFNNKVQLQFTQEQVQPGETVNLEVRAESGSFCSVRTVDKGLLHHKTHEDTLLPSDMHDWMSYVTTVNKRGFPYAIEDFEKYPCLKNNNEELQIQEAPWYRSEADVFTLFKQSNLKVFTNTKIRKPVVCSLSDHEKRISIKNQNTVALDTSRFSINDKKERKMPTIRRFFPDAWLYELVSVGPQGHTMLNLTTPDSITKWVTDAFCLGTSGFGVIKDAELITFKPYFIELITPYSVVQGEIFTIKALVFNYLKECLMVFVSLSDLGDYSAFKNKEKSGCICADQSTIFNWNVTALKLGDLKVHVSSASVQLDGGCTNKFYKLGKDHKEDNIEKTVIVKPLGILEEKIQTLLLCPEGNSIRSEVSLNVPDQFVPGSEQAHITVLGDLRVGMNADYVESLSYPSGCGENNLVEFIQVINLVKYFESIKQLTPKTRNKALAYLSTGYQRQLMFKNDNGSYSRFHGSQGSTWLTAFTIKSFIHAQDLIYIQEKHIDDAVRWLSSLQLPNGCFENIGEIFNNYLMAKETNEVTLTAYIAIALMEHGRVYNDTMVEKALNCLKDAVDVVNTTYSQALLAYVFTLSADQNLRQHMLRILEESAIRKEGSKHWAADANDHGDDEISAYVLLAILSDQNPSQQDIEESSTIINWIIKRLSWRSQASVVVFQALTKYAKATYQDNQDVTVTVKSLSGFQNKFHVDKDKSLLYQKGPLPDIPGKYTLTATGNGCVYIQTHVKYHAPPTKSDAYFVLAVSTQPSVCTLEAQTKFEILMEVSYSGERTESNMILLEVEFPSGFIPQKHSVKKLNKNLIVKRTEITPEKVIIYLEKLTHKTESLAFSIKQDTHVENRHPANVKVYDYYNPDEVALAEFHAPCSTVEGHCAVGISERKDCGYPSINREECEQRGCCFDSSVSESTWCFFQGSEKEETIQ